MNRTRLLLILSVVLLASCHNDPKADPAKIAAPQQVIAAVAGTVYKADLAQSRVVWTGSGPIGQEHGALMLKDGSLSVNKGNISSGKFDIDITSLKVDNADTGVTNKLTLQLKSPDFLDAAKYPTAVFELVNVQTGTDTRNLVMKDATHTVTGNLTLKGTTRSITFPAKVAVNELMVTADAHFSINRNDFGLVSHNSDSGYRIFIRPTVNIQLHLVANR